MGGRGRLLASDVDRDLIACMVTVVALDQRLRIGASLARVSYLTRSQLKLAVAIPHPASDDAYRPHLG
jgi:hypothetical protein